MSAVCHRVRGRITLSATKCFADYLLTALLHRWINSYQSLIKWSHKNFIFPFPLFDFMRCTRPLSTNNPFPWPKSNRPNFLQFKRNYPLRALCVGSCLNVTAAWRAQPLGKVNKTRSLQAHFYLCCAAHSCSSIHQAMRLHFCKRFPGFPSSSGVD